MTTTPKRSKWDPNDSHCKGNPRTVKQDVAEVTANARTLTDADRERLAAQVADGKARGVANAAALGFTPEAVALVNEAGLAKAVARLRVTSCVSNDVVPGSDPALVALAFD
jgi:metal-dependent amidase/aminoacylase/carboxypeptidase family protein